MKNGFIVHDIDTAPQASRPILQAVKDAWGFAPNLHRTLAESPAAPAGAPLAKPSTSEGNHLSYAFQWMAFAILGVVALLWAIRRERRIRAGTPAPTKRPSQGRVDDSAAEDELVEQWTTRS